MPVGLQFPLINGVRHSWSSISWKFAGITVAGVKSINYAAKLEPGIVYAGGPLPIGFTTGVGSFTADCEILLQEANMVQAALGPAFFTSIFDIEISYSDEGYTSAGVVVITDMIKRCRITEMSAAAQTQSGDAIVRKLTLAPLGMLFNGVDPMPNQPSLSIGGVTGTAAGVVNRLLV